MAGKQSKEAINCFTAMDKLATCASRLLRPRATPGFCSQNIEERLQAHHAAMDFSAGSGGRIISDPAEAAVIARLGSSTTMRSWGGLASPALASSKSSLDTEGGAGADPSTDLGAGAGAAWFKPSMGREQANSALFPHRHTDGMFIIRACSRQVSNYVLSFTSNRKVVHAQIVRVSHDGKNAFSLDGAKTKFARLEHLVDFYKMNAGPLPTLLRDTASVDSVASVTAPPSPECFSSGGFKECNFSSAPAAAAQFSGNMEHDT